jgi:hypothetical protein
MVNLRLSQCFNILLCYEEYQPHVVLLCLRERLIEIINQIIDMLNAY